MLNEQTQILSRRQTSLDHCPPSYNVQYTLQKERFRVVSNAIIFCLWYYKCSQYSSNSKYYIFVLIMSFVRMRSNLLWEKLLKYNILISEIQLREYYWQLHSLLGLKQLLMLRSNNFARWNKYFSNVSQIYETMLHK